MKILLIGSSGKMGQEIINITTKSSSDQIVACIDIVKNENPTTPYLCKIYHKTIWSVKEKADIIIDFSTKNSIKDILDYALLNNLPLAIFSTVRSEDEVALLKAASRYIPILLCPNASIGINGISKALSALSHTLPNSEIVITEYHHKDKLDSPSGTVKKLSQILQQNGIKNYQLQALRVGNEKGYHKVEFFMEDEVVTLSHRAYSRSIFARGAIAMARKLTAKKSGFFESL